MSTNDTYRALASGDPGMVRKFAPRVATLAAAARKVRAAAPSPAPSAPRAPAPIASPGSSRKLSCREKGNAMAQRLGGAPTDQAGIDGMWTGIADKLNATMPSSRTPSPGSASRAPQSQAAIDDMWASLAADGNERAGLKTPVMDRAR
jgi:hypothetical protein